MSEPQQIKTTTFNSFADWCLHKESLSEAARHTVEVLLHKAGTWDCYEADRILSYYPELDISRNQISDLSPISGLINLTQLSLSGNKITELSPLSGLTNLTQLHLYNNQISDLSALSGLINLTHLYLGSNQITDLSALSGLTNLTQLYLGSNQITDLSSLSGLINLTQLYLLHNHQITDLSSLSGLTNLTQLYLHNNQIPHLSSLSGLTNLTHLFLGNNQITDLSALSGLINLTHLYLDNNQITDLSALSGLINLTQLYLHNNQITDLSALSGLTNLTHLFLGNNQITDLSALSGLTNLIRLNLGGNPILNLTLLRSLQQKWRTLSTKPSDFQKAKKAIKFAYATIGKEAPEVLFLPSPHAGCTQLFNLLKLDNTPEEQRFGKLKSLLVWGESLSKQLQWFLEGLSFQALWKCIRSEIAPEQTAGDKEAWRELYELINNSPELIGADSSSFNADDVYPVTPTELFKQIYATEFYVSSLGVTLDQKTQEAFDCLNQLFEHCGLIFPFEKVCVVCDRPTKISLDNQNRLHAEGEPAIQFADGWHTGYYYHGVKLPEKYGKLHTHQWQAQWLLEEDNAELRRVLIQGIGYARICQELQATELDSWQEYTLLKLDADIDGFEPDDFDDDAPQKEPIHLLKMTCPSTNFIHAMRVPPDITSARAAIRWINWDIDPEEFSVQT
ncbi:leucine-rich repeat domain-containing protein [Trichocoleus sp. FACHB-90]|uniref:leucine-rich repeat domain-containing protein n=1 Tax=Cyanophyceae TaxID=3028117 RepID=UPI001684F74A|nr:leucine-rich repeat domain-containing protein [Trichocoleus sp. FACHB-90]MBD1928623.1 leucine-rich repeat domain-containing protein [Trichocoleus sp. FACHB-90]